jgi:hypothetical protein
MSDDLERTLHDSLSRHAAQLGRPAGEIDDIYRRVTHRRHRRRAVAGVGSLAIAAVGVLGIATLGRDGGRPPAAGAPDGGAWACTGYMGGDGVVSYYADCQIVDQVPVTTSCLTPMTAPVTWVDTTLGSPQNAVAEACPVAMPVVDSSTTIVMCEAPGTVPAPTTGAPMTTSPVPPTISTILSTPISTPLPSVPEDDPACHYQQQAYGVLPGDSVYSIARLFGIDPQTLADHNSWPDGIDHPLLVGDVILIPPGAPTLTVTTVPYLIDTTAVGTLPPATTAPPPSTVPVTTAP